MEYLLVAIKIGTSSSQIDTSMLKRLALFVVVSNEYQYLVPNE